MPAHIRIRRRRESLQMTQEELAASLQRHLPNFSAVMVSKMETGRRKINADELAALARVLKCQVDDLLDPLPD